MIQLSKNRKMILIIAVIAIIAVMVSGNGNTQAVVSGSCTNSDGYKENIYLKGVAVWKYGSVVLGSDNDACVGPDMIRETYCDGDEINSYTRDCGGSGLNKRYCFDAQCEIPNGRSPDLSTEKQVRCSKSGDEANLKVDGVRIGKYKDLCLDSSQLLKSSCAGDTINYEIFDCSSLGVNYECFETFCRTLANEDRRCVDGDNGNVPTIASTVIEYYKEAISDTESDRCNDGRYLTEYFCDGVSNKIISEVVDCKSYGTNWECTYNRCMVEHIVVPNPVCGNGICESEEFTTCTQDCAGQLCGNGICEEGELNSCQQDCPTACGDGACEGTENWLNCASDCDPYCGDLVCNNGETCATCSGDCGTCQGTIPTCNNDGTCQSGEATTCADCTEPPEEEDFLSKYLIWLIAGIAALALIMVK